MDRAERWARAKRDTHSLKDWRRGLAVAVLGGVCSIVALGLFGPKDAQLTEALVIGGSIVGAYVLRPVAELVWSFLWSPWKALTEEVANLRTAQPTTAAVDPDAANKRFKAVSGRLGILRMVEEELRPMQKAVSKSLTANRRGALDTDHPTWDRIAPRLSALPDMQGLYESLRDRIEELDDVQLYYVESGGSLSDESRERLLHAQVILDGALENLDKEIKRLAAIK